MQIRTYRALWIMELVTLNPLNSPRPSPPLCVEFGRLEFDTAGLVVAVVPRVVFTTSSSATAKNTQQIGTSAAETTL